MSTYSVVNIKISNELSFTPGPTAGFILAIGANGVSYWTSVTGPTGSQGIQGIQGATGDTGATGSQGIQGITGDTGATGSQGIQGIQGSTGPQGDQGIQGATGSVGSSGLTYSSTTSYITTWTGATALGTSSILIQNNDIAQYQGVIVTATVSGGIQQSLTGSHQYVYNLSGNATFSYTNPKVATYNFLVNAGTNTFTLVSGFFKTEGATALGYTGSFAMSGMYDGSRMWISTVKNYTNL